MLAQGKTAIIYGGSGAIGTAVARVLVREGATVFIGGRSAERLKRAKEQLGAAGDGVATFVVDVLDERATRRHAAELAARTGGFDIALNATSHLHDQGTAFLDLSLDEFMRPIGTFLPALFSTSRAVAPHMGGERTGVIVALTAPAARMAVPGHLGHIVTCAAEEAYARALAAELAPRNIRVVCLRSHAVSDAPQAGSYTAQLFASKAQAAGMTVDEWLGAAAQGTMTGRLPTLSEVAETVAFIASGHARAMTAAIVNLTAGLVPD